VGALAADRRRRVIALELPRGDAGVRLLCLGAHADDIEIGCGGTVLRWLREGRLASVTWVVLSGAGERGGEARASAAAFLAGAGSVDVQVDVFPDAHFPAHVSAIKERFEALARAGTYDVVLTHARHDRHQDHRVVSDLTWNTWRDHLVLEYEVMKVDGDLLPPNLYVPLDDETRRTKVDLLLRHFPSQASKHWFDADTFNGLMRLRGLEANAPERHAEAFHAHKIVL
jgi:LmbE family N-acetylglucosaminyl deacetylase